MNKFNSIPSAPCTLYGQINMPYGLYMTVKTSAGVNINLSTGYTADLYILPAAESDLDDALIHITNLTGITLGNGYISVDIDAEDMTLDETNYYYFLIVTPTAGTAKPYLEGKFLAKYAQVSNAGVESSLSLVVNSQPSINLSLQITNGYTQAEVNALLATKVGGASGDAAAMAVKEAELIAAAYSGVYFYYNTDDHRTYMWNGSNLA